MKHFKKLLCVVLTLLLIVPGGLAEDMALALNTEETGASFEGDVSSVSANNDDGAAADEDAAFSISSVDSDVAEAGEMDLPADDGDVGALSVQADYTDAPSASTVTYCFIALDTLVASRTAAEGEEIAAPDAPAAPEGMVFAGWALEDGTAVFADDTPVIARTDPIISEINVIAKFAEAEIPAAPAVFAPSDEDTGSEDGAGAAGDASVSDNTEPVEEPGEGSAPAAADETAPVAADETEPGADDDPEADADAGTDGNGEEGGDADQEDADAAKDGEAVNNADAEKDAEEEGNENAGALEDDPAEGEPNGDDASGEDGDEASGEAEAALQPIRVVFNITPADAVVTVKALDSEAGEAAEEQPDAQPADETPDRTSDNTDASITAQDDGSFALLPGAYTYTASAEGYKPAQDVPFTVAGDALTIDIALEAEAEVSDEESADGAVAEEAQEAQEAEETDGAEEYPPFDQSATCNGVVVAVKADAGTFPAGAALHVSRVLLYEQRQADAAVDEVRDENMTVESSYTFDIKVLDDAGNELQPADGHAVSVSFSVDTVADENLTTTIYHIEEEGGSYTAASLETVEYGDTASAETDGFSIYTVEFAYENMTYSVEGVSQTLYWILKDLGLVGEMTDVTDVNVSKPELFNAVSYGSGDWIIASYRAFSSEEWMEVTIKGHTYRITVTFNWEPVSYIDENGQVKQISEYSLVQSSDEPITWTGWYVLDDNTTIPERITVSGEAHLILCPYKTLWAEKGITVAAGNTLNIYAQSTSVGQDVKGVLYSGITKEGTSGTPAYCAGIGGEQGGACGTINIIGGEIHATGGQYGAGIGGGNSGAGGTVTIGDTAQVTANGGDNAAGIGGGNSGAGGTVTIGSMAQVTANGGQYGAGIGGGNDGAGGTVTIGGTAQVTATGGSYGAGIGGGWNGAGGTVTISGGAVTLQTNSTAQPIGHGSGDDSLSPGSLYLSRMHAFTSTSGESPVGGSEVLSTCQNKSNTYVRLERCTEDTPCYHCYYGNSEYAYKDAQGNVFNLLTGTAVTSIYSATYRWDSGWYAVEDDVTINDRVTVNGTVNLILCDGTDGEDVKTLTAAQGITVDRGNTLNIYVGKNGAAYSASDIQGNGELIAGTQGNTPDLRAGIGGDHGAGGTVNIYGGYVKASGGENGAGIGGAGGTVNIYGGEVLAIGGVKGAGIGGGQSGDGGTVNIYGGKVTAQGGVDGAGIGGGEGGDGGTVTISGGTVIASGGENGAGIGSADGGAGGTVTVNGGTVNATGGEKGAGIGVGSMDGIIGIVTIGDKITISGGTVTANGGYNGAGIGVGSMVTTFGNVSFDGAIEISGGTVTALGGENGAGIGIGSRQGAQGEFNFKGKINIYGGKVDATGGENGAGIGGGNGGDGGTIEISGGVVRAFSNGYGAGIGGGNGGAGGNITVNGGNITASGGTSYGAGIGGGYQGAGGNITIEGTANIEKAQGADGGAGIGGGKYGVGGTITISGGKKVTATGGDDGAGIGGGKYGVGGTITISGKANVTTQGGENGAGIGGGYQGAGGNITIEGTANITNAQGGTGGAGIGGGEDGAGGNITISGGKKVTANGGSDGGAGIGGGKGGAGGTIKISGGTVEATGGLYGAGIGGGKGGAGGTITISGGTVEATGGLYGAGIGGGYQGAGGNITIEGTANITNALGGTGGAGIGSGDNGKGGSITINGGEVTATGGECGAGIGGGRYGQVESITIEGGTIEATGGLYAAGIGGGMAGKGDGYQVHGGTIKISDGTVNATGGEKGAGIGGGWEGAGGNITIEGGTVTAIGGEKGAGIGSGYLCQFGPSSVTISGGTVTANGGSGGAGIGAGMDSLKAGIVLSYSATGGVPELPKITSSSYVGDVTMSGDFCEWLDAGHYGVVFDAENANVDLYKEAMAGLTIVPCPAGAHRIGVQLLPGYGGGAPRNRAFAAMKTKTGKEIPVSKAFGGSSIALRVEAAPGCEIEYRPSRLTGSDGREIHLDRNDAFTMPDCDVSAYLTRWAWLQWAIDRAANAEGSPSITLTADVRAEKWEKALAVPKGRPVTIDLAGCSIDRNLNNAAENGGVIDVTGALTVKDGSQSRTGKITGGYTVGNGGGAYVHGGGALTLTGGAVTGNRAAQGGGVYVADGSFSVSGAPKVTGNTCNGAANNVYLPRGAVIDVAGGLESGATIGVTTASNPETDGAVTLTRGLNGRGAPTAFASDEGYNVAWSSDGQEAVLPAQETILPAKLKAYGKTSLRLSWNAVDGAEGYDVFFALCGSNTYRLAGTVTDRLSYRFRKLNRHTCYKAYVRAWRTVDGVKTYTGVESLRLHAVTGGYAHKITNPKKVTVKRKAVKLAPGGKVRMGAKVTGVRSGKKVLSHVNRLRYYSTNPTVATVDEKGRITAVSLGECTVYAVANNGIRKGTRVTVRENTVKKGKK